jgi:hypothetical protein
MAKVTIFSPYKNYLLLFALVLIIFIVLFYFLIGLGVKKGFNNGKQKKGLYIK